MFGDETTPTAAWLLIGVVEIRAFTTYVVMFFVTKKIASPGAQLYSSFSLTTEETDDDGGGW